jgi:hypothetical protein
LHFPLGSQATSNMTFGTFCEKKTLEAVRMP